MVGSSACEVIFISVNHSITFVGKVWFIVMIFLRILILLFAGYPLYQDEQDRFICNTIQPGCANVCYDLISPVSLFRFWLVQLIALCLPYLVFIIYVIHKVSNGLTVDRNPAGPVRIIQLYKIQQELYSETSVKKLSVGAEWRWAWCFTGAYILHLLFRTMLEVGFGAAHYFLFGFHIPKRFLCQHPPCTTQVDCYISRPTEKTVMLNFMLSVATLSLLLNVVDFICAVKRSLRQRSKRKMILENVYEEEQRIVPTTRRELKSDVGRSFRKRQGSGGSYSAEALGHGGLSADHASSPPPASSFCNISGNNDYDASQDKCLEQEGSEVALCPLEPVGTPRSIRVNKHSRLKPPPPPRRDFLGHPGGSGTHREHIRDDPAGAVVCTRRMGQYTLVEVAGAEHHSGEEGQEKRSEWV